MPPQVDAVNDSPILVARTRVPCFMNWAADRLTSV